MVVLYKKPRRPQFLIFWQLNEKEAQWREGVWCSREDIAFRRLEVGILTLSLPLILLNGGTNRLTRLQLCIKGSDDSSSLLQF